MPPPMQRVTDIIPDATPAVMRQRARAWGQATGRFSNEVESFDTTVYAEVNAGRWMIPRCPTEGCFAGILLDPEWNESICTECGRVYRPIWPPTDDRAAIEALLGVRPTANQNWVPGETLEQLAQDNTDHGL